MVIALTRDIEALIEDQARRLGTTPEEFVIDTLRQRLAALDGNSNAWESLLRSVGSPAGVSLTDEATSREELYD